jgi:hemoglobin-like flavoprotein
VVFAEAPVAGAQAEAHMRETLRRFATLVSATARPHLPSDLDPALLDLVGQALVGTLERVVVDWQDERLPDALADVAECVVALQLATLRGLGWTDDQPPS